MSKVTLEKADLVEISAYLDQVADRLSEDEEGVAIGPREACQLSAQLQHYAGMLLRWNW